jgi:hypothetical protein
MDQISQYKAILFLQFAQNSTRKNTKWNAVKPIYVTTRKFYRQKKTSQIWPQQNVKNLSKIHTNVELFTNFSSSANQMSLLPLQ